MYKVQYAAQRGAHTVHCYTILITMHNVQYAAQCGAHTVHCHTIHVSTNTSIIQWEGQELPWKVSNPSKGITYPLYRGVRVKPLTPTTGSTAICRLLGKRQVASFPGWGRAGWRSHDHPASPSFLHTIRSLMWKSNQSILYLNYLIK